MINISNAVRKLASDPILGIVAGLAKDGVRTGVLSTSFPLQVLEEKIIEPNKHYKERTAQAQQELQFTPLTRCEVEYILDTATKRKLNLADLNIPDPDFVTVAFRRDGLFTYAYLKVVDEATDSTFLKVGVTKRHAKEVENEDTAVRVSLWRAVMAPPVRVEHTPVFTD